MGTTPKGTKTLKLTYVYGPSWTSHKHSVLNKDHMRKLSQKKLHLSILHARECSRETWQDDKGMSKEWRRLKREAMQDARYWQKVLADNQPD